MDNRKDFLNVVGCFDEPIREYIEKMGLPYALEKHITKQMKIGMEINTVLTELITMVPKAFETSVLYILGELTDNIEQHSRFTETFISVDYNSHLEELKIVVFDDGAGIPTVFAENNIPTSKDSQAIMMALEGKTTKKEDISRGFGLRTTKAIVDALNGEMQIISCKGMLIINDGKIKPLDFAEGQLNGTLVYLKLKTPEKSLNIYPYLE